MTRKQPMNPTKLQLPAMVFACILVGPVAWQAALAESPTATDDLDVQVEFAAGLTLVCGTLNFGTISVELGERTGGNQVQVNAPGDEVTLVGTGNVALGGDAAAAECKITGINSPVDTTISASTTTDVSTSLMSLTGAPTGDGGPDDDYSGTLSVQLNLYDYEGTFRPGWNGVSEVVYNGTDDTESTFHIGGLLFIPADDFEAENMGKYEASVTIEVEEEDV